MGSGRKHRNLEGTAQGFFLQLGLAIPIYNAGLSLFYLLVVKYNVKEPFLRRRFEPCMHSAAFLLSMGTSCASVGLDLFNNANLWCWIAPLPPGCQEENSCVRGKNAWIYRWAFYYAPLWFCIVFVMITMWLVYRAVRQIEGANVRYRKHERKMSTVEDYQRSREVASQALCYVGAFYATFLFSTINRILQQTRGQTYFPLLLLHSMFDPLQVFLNFIVYRRPQFRRYGKEHPDASLKTKVREALQFSNSVKRKAEARHLQTEHYQANRLQGNAQPTNNESSFIEQSNAESNQADTDEKMFLASEIASANDCSRPKIDQSIGSGLLNLVLSKKSHGLRNNTEEDKE